MSSLRVKAITSLRAEFSVPGDKSISHRAAIFSGLSNGTCEISNFLPSEDCLHTLKAMRALGAGFETIDELDGYGPVRLRVHGFSMKPAAPEAPIDCGNSGTGMRLLAGVLAGQDFNSELFGDASLSSRPMGRIITPLTQMGGHIETRGAKDGCAPLKIHGRKLRPISYEMPVASAQVKSAVLLAGLFAEGTSTVVQRATTRDHTERMCTAFQISCRTNDNVITIPGRQMPESCDIAVPGDISSAAFWLVAAAGLDGSRLMIKDVGLNPTRTAILAVLGRMGAEIKEILHTSTGEPMGNIEIKGGPLVGTELRPEEIPNLIDEIPVIAVAAALAKGETHIRNARELRVKETDRITTTVENLRKMGVDVEEFEDGMVIHGGKPLKSAEIQSHGDHRIAMAFSIAGLFAKGDTTVHDIGCINTSYPGFTHHMDAIRHARTDPADYELPLKRK